MVIVLLFSNLCPSSFAIILMGGGGGGGEEREGERELVNCLPDVLFWLFLVAVQWISLWYVIVVLPIQNVLLQGHPPISLIRFIETVLEILLLLNISTRQIYSKVYFTHPSGSTTSHITRTMP